MTKKYLVVTINGDVWPPRFEDVQEATSCAVNRVKANQTSKHLPRQHHEYAVVEVVNVVRKTRPAPTVEVVSPEEGFE